MISVVVWEIDEFGNKNLYTVREFESRFIAEEFMDEMNKHYNMLAEIES